MIDIIGGNDKLNTRVRHGDVTVEGESIVRGSKITLYLHDRENFAKHVRTQTIKFCIMRETKKEAMEIA